MSSDGFPNLMTVREAAEVLRCTPQTVYRMLDAGQLAEVRIGHKRLVDADQMPLPKRVGRSEFPPQSRRVMRGTLIDAVQRFRAAEEPEDAA